MNDVINARLVTTRGTVWMPGDETLKMKVEKLVEIALEHDEPRQVIIISVRGGDAANQARLLHEQIRKVVEHGDYKKLPDTVVLNGETYTRL